MHLLHLPRNIPPAAHSSSSLPKMVDLEKDNNNNEQQHLPRLESDTSSQLGDDYGIDEKSLVRKLDWKLLPGVSLLYLLSFLDRSNVANAKLDGLANDIHMTSDEYLTGLTVFFIGYISLEVFWNIILKRIGPKLWLPSITVAWGIVATLQGIVVNKAGFYVVRTFLGITEGGLFPGVVFYLSMWYTREERTFRIALFFSAASLAGAFGGILAYVSAIIDKSYTKSDKIGHWFHGGNRRSRWMVVDLHHRKCALKPLFSFCRADGFFRKA